jgi:hypothetical protein
MSTSCPSYFIRTLIHNVVLKNVSREDILRIKIFEGKKKGDASML